MPTKELNTTYKEKKIRVQNTWLSGVKLYIDGDCRDTSYRLFAIDPKQPVLSASIETESGTEVIEVFMVAVMTLKIKIHANDKFIAGEQF